MYKHVTLELLREKGLKDSQLIVFEELIKERDLNLVSEDYPKIKENFVNSILECLTSEFTCISVNEESLICEIRLSHSNELHVQVIHPILDIVCQIGVNLDDDKVSGVYSKELVRLDSDRLTDVVKDFTAQLKKMDIRKLRTYMNEDVCIDSTFLKVALPTLAEYKRVGFLPTRKNDPILSELESHLDYFTRSVDAEYAIPNTKVQLVNEILKELILRKDIFKAYVVTGNNILFVTGPDEYIRVNISKSKDKIKQLLLKNVSDKGYLTVSDVASIMNIINMFPKFSKDSDTLEEVLESTKLAEKLKAAKDLTLSRILKEKQEVKSF